jgi:acetylxylan esterase
LSPAQPAAPAAEVGLVAARGTSEPQSGSRLLGPLGDLIASRSLVPATYVELEYPASYDLQDSVGRGVTALTDLLNGAAAEAPHRRHVLMGYSQGAWVIGEALLPPAERTIGRDAEALTPQASASISAVLFFGDPRFTAGEAYNAGTYDPGRQSDNPRPPGQLKAWEARLRNYCAQGDIACQGDGGTYIAHLAYLTNSMPAEGADFALQCLAADLRQGELR